MKKITALILSTITLAVIICSCGNNQKPVETETDENGEIVTTTTTAKQTTTKNTEKETTSTIQKNIETTKKNDTTEFPEDHYLKTGYPVRYKYIETPTRVIIPIREFTYYSKLDNERYYFCFDPLCDHNRTSCVARIFGGTKESVYSPYTNRLYAVRTDTIFSMNFDGSDIKLEFSFDDIGSDITKPAVRQGIGGRITSLQQYDNYLYFLYPAYVQKEELIGYDIFWSLYRYDLKTRKLENLSENVGHQSNYLKDYILTKNKIYFYDLDIDGEMYFFSANLDLTDIKKTSLDKDDYFDKDFMIYDGENLYSMYVEYKEEKFPSGLPIPEYYQIVSFNPETETVLGVSEKSYYSAEKSSGTMTLYAVTDDYIYYTVSDPFYIGTKHTKSGDRDVFNRNHTIYRMKKDGSDKKVVFEGVTSKDPRDISYEFHEMYITEDGSKIVAEISAYQYSTPEILPDGMEYANWEGGFYASFDIDDNGNFVNMHELALDFDE